MVKLLIFRQKTHNKGEKTMKNSVEMIKSEENNGKNIIEEEKTMEKEIKKEVEVNKNIIINDVTPETRKKLDKSKKKEVKMEEKKAVEKKEEPVKEKKAVKTNKSTGGDKMDRSGIEKVVKEMAAKAKLVCSQGVGRVNSDKAAPVQVRNAGGEVIVAVRAGELLFHLPYEEVVKVGRGHGGGWPHCTKVFYNTVGEADVRKAVGNAFKEKNSVKYWKEVYGSKGRVSTTKKLDPQAELKMLLAKEAELKKSIAEAKKAAAGVKAASKKEGGDKVKKSGNKKVASAAITKVAESVA